jgi:hypothetical protein
LIAIVVISRASIWPAAGVINGSRLVGVAVGRLVAVAVGRLVEVEAGVAVGAGKSVGCKVGLCCGTTLGWVVAKGCAVGAEVPPQPESNSITTMRMHR